MAASESSRSVIIPLTVICLLLISFLAFPDEAAAQEESFDTKGTDFWLAYPPNYHNHRRSSNPYQRLGDSLYIFIAAEEPTSGRIEYWDVNSKKHVYNFNITNINQVHTFKVPYLNFEVFGYNDSGQFTTGGNSCEKVVKRAFHVTSEKDITIYGHSQAVMTSESFMVFPTDVIGDHYFVMSYNSDGHPGYSQYTQPSTPSQFLVVATEDSTSVQIMPSTETYRNGNNKQTVMLDRGEVYLVQAKIDQQGTHRDLTGTEIIASKPVAVFGSHQRTPFPKQNDLGPSRDILLEQMPPTKVWGTTAFITPYANVQSEMPAPDRFRVLASNDNTEVYINGSLHSVLNRGEFLEEGIWEPAELTSSQPVLVAQYRRSSNDASQQYIGDPFMMIIPPFEQFDHKYRFINLQAYEFEIIIHGSPVYRQVYEEQYITIITTKKNINTLRIDGGSVSQNQFEQIAQTDYYYADIAVSDGVHYAEADDIFGLYVYGMGVANSYGYVGGMNMTPLDTDPPAISGSIECGKASGMVSDTMKYDSQLADVKCPEESKINTTVEVNFMQMESIATFEGELINEYLDGSFRITAIDGVQFHSEQLFSIPGFTIAPEPMRESGPIAVRAVETGINKERCFDVALHNYGKFDGVVTKATFKKANSNFKLKTPLPIPIESGKIKNIEICFTSGEEGPHTDTLILGDDCFDRHVLAINANVKGDEDKPQADYQSDSCKTEFDILFTEHLPTDLGVETIEVVDTTNCLIELMRIEHPDARIKIRVADPKKDAYYKISVVDSAGNETIYEEAIPGMTLEIAGMPAPSELDFGNHPIGALVCDTIGIHNYGKYPITLQEAYIYEKIHFTLPESQMPLTIESGETESVYVCFRATEAAEEPYRDTLELYYNCVDMPLMLRGIAENLHQERNSRCDFEIELRAGEVPDDYFIEQNHPNPVFDNGSVVFGVPESTTLKIAIYDSFGNRRGTIAEGEFDAGIYEAALDAADLPTGVYVYILETPAVRIHRKMLINK